jgi:hypothetical protein
MDAAAQSNPSPATASPRIFVDADACPVKSEIYKVADRYGLSVTLVSNSWMRIPQKSRYELKVVGDDLDAADDWIAEQIARDDIAVTADIPLARRCLEKEAVVISPHGKPFDGDNIGQALATRDLLSELRSAGEKTGGPPPMQPRDRSRFLQALDNAIQAIRRRQSRESSASTRPS